MMSETVIKLMVCLFHIVVIIVSIVLWTNNIIMYNTCTAYLQPREYEGEGVYI